MNNSTGNLTTSVASINPLPRMSEPVDIFLFAINFVFGFPTYSYVIWLITRGTGSVASELFLLNLCVCEISGNMYSTLALLSVLFPSVTIGLVFFQGFGISGRCVFQCLICVERYLAVVHPITFLKYKPLRYRLICSIPGWMIILGSCLFVLYSSKLTIKHPYTLFFSTQFFLFFSIQLLCLLAVLRALKQPGPGMEDSQMKRKAFHLILIITVGMVATYLPYSIISFSYILTDVFIAELFSFSYACFVFAGFVHPLLYLHRAGKLSSLYSLLVRL